MAGKELSKYRRSDAFTYTVFLFPAVAFLVCFTLFPFLYSVYLSFHSWTLTRPGPPEWYGLSNYLRLLGDQQFRGAIGVTLSFVAAGLPLQLILGFVIAMLLNHPGRLYRVLRTLFLVPMMITPIAAGLMWTMLYNNEYGAIRDVLARLGITHVPIWLGNPGTALPAVLAVDSWQWVPMVLLFLLAGLHAIPSAHFEVAQIEGASWFQTIRFVILPALQPVIVVVLLLRGMDMFKLFDLIFVMTRGGPGTATETMTYYAYRTGFAMFDMGYAAALSIVILAIVTVLSQAFIRRTVYERKRVG